MKKPQDCLEKERLVSLMDAVLAIIMTLLVLNLPSPRTPALQGFWALRNSYFAYTLSFFWLGILWMALNRLFTLVSFVNSRVMGIGLGMLFACSLVPYLTLLASDDFNSSLIQTLFGFCTGSVNILFAWMMAEISRYGQNSPALKTWIRQQNRQLTRSFLIKAVGIVLAWIIWPPAVMISIIVSAVISVIYNRRNRNASAKKHPGICF